MAYNGVKYGIQPAIKRINKWSLSRKVDYTLVYAVGFRVVSVLVCAVIALSLRCGYVGEYTTIFYICCLLFLHLFHFAAIFLQFFLNVGVECRQFGSLGKLSNVVCDFKEPIWTKPHALTATHTHSCQLNSNWRIL